MVSQSSLDGLFYPPGTVGGEFTSLGRVETLDGLHQANVTLANEIEQRQADALIVARYFHDETKVGFDHLLAGLLVSFLNSGGKIDFFLGS